MSYDPMSYALKRLVVVALLAVAAVPAPFAVAQAQACSSSWSSSEYKPYSQVKREVNQRLGNARILRVELCGTGASAYFRVVAIVGSTRQELRISAR